MELENNGSEEIIEMFCELCKKKGKNRSADGFCVDCVLYMCVQCMDYHTFFLPDHDQKDKQDMPQDVCLKQCPAHSEEIIKFFCPSCNVFFCSLCKKKDHRYCRAVSHLPELVKELENGQDYLLFKRKIISLASRIEDLESHMNKMTLAMDTSSEDLISQIESSREKLFKLTNDRVEALKMEVQSIKDKDKISAEEPCSKMAALTLDYRDFCNDIHRKENGDRRCEMFMAMKQTQDKIKSFKADFQCHFEHKCILTGYKFKEYEDSETVYENASRLGKLDFDETMAISVFERVQAENVKGGE